MTDRTKTICPPIFDLGGIKISYLIDFINSSGHMLEAMHKSVVSFFADFFKDLLSSFSPLSGILKFL